MDRRKFFRDSLAGLAGWSAWAASTEGKTDGSDEQEPSVGGKYLSAGDPQYALQMDRLGNVRKIVFRDKFFKPPSDYSFFELDGQLVEAESMSGSRGLCFRVSTERKELIDRSGERQVIPSAHGRMNVSFQEDFRFHFEPDQRPPLFGEASGTRAGVKEVGLVLTFPAQTVFHLAEFFNIGRLLDKDMPVGESYTGQLAYNFFLAESDGLWIRFRTEEKKWLNRAKVHVARHPQMFTVTFTWPTNTDARVSLFSSMEEALADYEKWLETECGMRKLKDRSDAPKWIREIRLVITLDMMRSNWEITNDYADLMKLAKEIKEIRDPREVLFYIPGWQGPYDATFPSYKPHADLGGDEKFREMIAYLHSNGFKLMIHTTIWGIDPYNPAIEKLQDLVLRDANGEPFGWQIGENWLPTPEPLKFRTPQISLRGLGKGGNLSFKTDPIPGRCEALFTLGGVKAKQGRIGLTVGRRSLHTPAGWFEHHDEFGFPFPLLLEPGANQVQVNVTGGDGVDWSDSWYKIRYTFTPRSPYASWTFPILMADTTNPEYIALFTEAIRSVVSDYRIDALHTDAGIFYRPTQAKELFVELKRQLPGVAHGSEWFETFEEINHFHLSQNARQSLTNYPGMRRCPCEQGSVSPSEGLDELYAWLDKPSPVCRFVRDYIVLYPHLCAANAFVPIGKVCNIFPPRQMPPRKEELWKILRDARRLDYVPALRVNYRQFGLDPDTKKAIRELG